ncbi:MAG: trypsin-like peptidase domain-containing protein [Chloroflexia bacterium]|nr:trypsin-like peptidase domain-containing protein [Chloroflexia bacterium]MDQ3515099.1 trypsin-like peptidase domain-containing protein [Chloroflexota bacterium]
MISTHHARAVLGLALIAVVALGALVIAAIASPSGGLRTPAALAQSAGTAEAMTAVEVVQQVNPAVVTVINRQVIAGTSTDQSIPQGAGTGFFIDQDGTVVTNQHVVANGDDFSVFLSTGEEREAELIGADATSDLAVLRVEGETPAIVAFGDSDALLPGETVLAIGSPLGTFTNTVTEGIVSAIGRTPQEFQSAETVYTNLVQHDAAINPGNSGGPLFNLAGEVVGVNTLGIPESGGVPAQGLFFAIPSSTVQDVVGQLIDNGEVLYPFFGVESLPVTDVIVAQADLSVDYGQVVIAVSDDSPAEEAGIEPGDVIIEIGGERIDDDTPFIEVLFNYAPGDTVPVTVQRGDETVETEITLAERPA